MPFLKQEIHQRITNFTIDEFLEMFDLKKMRDTEFVIEDNKLDIDLLLQKSVI